MGVPYYQMNSVHNGRRFRMLIYSRHWESIVPETNELGIPNDYINFYNKDGSVLLDDAGNERKIYFEWTDEKNYMESVVSCKKHYITDIRNAVQSQLLYFSNVDFKIIDEGGGMEIVPVQAPILFEDEALIISDNNQFSKPHIVINSVSYGYVNFEELELEQSNGNIGIKVSSGEIDVTPNRENVIWNDTTREVVLKRFKQASKAAKRIIMESFQQEDFKEWLGACAGVFGWGNSVSAKTPGIRALIQLQNIAKVKGGTHPEFKPNPAIKYTGYMPDMFPGLKVRLVKMETIKRKKGTVEEVTRFELTAVSGLFEYPVYMQGINSSLKRDEYLLRLHPSGFIVIRDPKAINIGIEDESETNIKELELSGTVDEKEFVESLKKGTGKSNTNDGKLTIPLLIEGYPRYEDVKIVELTEAEKPKAEETAEERRRREKRIVIQTPRGPDQLWHKVEPKVEVLDTIDKEFYWGNNDDRDGIKLAATITSHGFNKGGNRRANELNIDDKVLPHWQKMGIDTTSWRWQSALLYNWGDPDAKVLLGVIAQENNKYLQDEHFHISEFFNRIDEGVITMADALVKWNTGRIINQLISPMGYMEGMDRFDKQKYAAYKELQAYASEHYVSIHGSGLPTMIVEHLDKVAQLQDEVRSCKSDDNVYIASVVQQLFGDNAADTVTDARAYIPELVDKARELSEWTRPIQPMLQLVDRMKNNWETWSLEHEEAVREYIDWRTS